MSWTREEKDDLLMIIICLVLGLVVGSALTGMWVDVSWRNRLITRDMAHWQTDPINGGQFFVYGPAPLNKEKLEVDKERLEEELSEVESKLEEVK